MILTEDEYLLHYGILRKSGRYPWGSGEDQETRNRDFLSTVDVMRKQGLSEVEIARGFDISTTQLRAAKSIAKSEQKQAQIGTAQRLKDKGYGNVAIGLKMGLPESSVRQLLIPGQADKAQVLDTTSNMLRDAVKERTYIDVGTGVEAHMGISTTKLSNAVARLREEGYELHDLKIQQPGTGQYTNFKVLCPEGTTRQQVFMNRDKVQIPTQYSIDGGRTALGIHPPVSISSKRVGITYAEDGGAAADGVIYVRPGVDDIHMGNSRYAQVRIAVDGTHYLKGMAMYKDDLPDGTDLQFNTNKKNTGVKHDAMKKMSDDPDNPFGAVISRQQGVMNIVNEEGDWARWSKTLSAQMLSKQPPSLAKAQLDLTYEARRRDYDEISALTNPAVKRKLLQEFSDGTDSAAVHLKAAALPNQKTHVILPISTMPPSQIYAPGYKDGESVVLIRFPHGGTFEIPELTVNNKHPEAKRLLGKNVVDAVGIHHSVAERLSGADFDGDTVLVIPNDSGKVKTSPALEGLKNFDAKASYPAYPGMKPMSPKTKQIEMGKVSNLITDMTIQKASTAEVARAVRHSMVVIDAEKHNLNYRQSAIDNGITQLRQKYQHNPTTNSSGGASTLISKGGSETQINERRLRSASKGGPIDLATGKLVYEDTGRTRGVDSKGRPIYVKAKVEKLTIADNAHSLSSGTPIERIYADHSNRLKDLANKARLTMVNTPSVKYSPSAKKAYGQEVSSLDSKLAIAIRNRPLERQAIVFANTTIAAKRAANPDMDATTLKKIKGQALVEARNRVGAGKQRIQITDSEWQAIQAGAISENKLSQILDNADMDRVRELATPRNHSVLTTAMTTRARLMLETGYTRAEVASAIGVSVSTLDRSTEI